MIRPALIAFLTLALTACGFHLRDELVLPPEIGSVHVKARDRYSPLADSLENGIRRAGVPIAESPEGVAVLDILSERWGDTPISVDQLGRAQEYSLRYAVIFELRRSDGTKAVQRQTLELSRDYISNPINTIGTEGEREILVRELRREMAASVLRRIGAILRVTGGEPMAETPVSRLDDPVAEDAARAALEAADALPPPDEPAAPMPVEVPAPLEPVPAEPAPPTPPDTPR
jgi:LPS-assembly lipoprotein